MAQPQSFHHQAVRDLYWACSSEPMMEHPNDSVYSQVPDRDWIAQLDADPSKLDSKMEQLHHSEKEIQKHSDIMSQLKSRMVSGSRTD